MSDEKNDVPQATIHRLDELDPDWKVDPPTPDQRTCYHWRIQLDVAHRTVHCDDCGCVLTAFDWLHDMARHERNLFDNYRELRKRVKELAEEVEELERQERNTKARLRRAKKKQQKLGL